MSPLAKRLVRVSLRLLHLGRRALRLKRVARALARLEVCAVPFVCLDLRAIWLLFFDQPFARERERERYRKKKKKKRKQQWRSRKE